MRPSSNWVPVSSDYAFNGIFSNILLAYKQSEAAWVAYLDQCIRQTKISKCTWGVVCLSCESAGIMEMPSKLRLSNFIHAGSFGRVVGRCCEVCFANACKHDQSVVTTTY